MLYYCMCILSENIPCPWCPLQSACTCTNCMDAQRKHASAAEASLVADDISATIVLLVMGEAGVSATSFPNNFFLGGGA